MKGLTYDSGALIAAERSERKMWALHKRALDRGVRPSVPAAALTAVYRSARQVNLSRMLAGCRIDPLEETTAKAAGELLGKCTVNPGAVDASIAESALRRGDAVVSGNADHLRALADGVSRKLDVIAV